MRIFMMSLWMTPLALGCGDADDTKPRDSADDDTTCEPVECECCYLDQKTFVRTTSSEGGGGVYGVSGKYVYDDQWRPSNATITHTSQPAGDDQRTESWLMYWAYNATGELGSYGLEPESDSPIASIFDNYTRSYIYGDEGRLIEDAVAIRANEDCWGGYTNKKETTTYEYNDAGRLDQTERETNFGFSELDEGDPGSATSTSHVYDSEGRLTETNILVYRNLLIDSDGELNWQVETGTRTYAYNEDGKLEQAVIVGDYELLTPVLTDFSDFDTQSCAGRADDWNSDLTKTVAYRYDSDGRLSEMVTDGDGPFPQRIQYTYDTSGNLTLELRDGAHEFYYGEVQWEDRIEYCYASCDE